MKADELGHIIIALIILAFSASWVEFGSPDIKNFAIAGFFLLITLSVTITLKKLAARHFDVEEKSKIWTAQRYWFRKGDYLKTKIPLGIILPFLFTFLSLGKIPWYASLKSELKPLKSRAAKKHGHSSFTELTDWHIAKITAIGIIAPLTIGLLAYVANLKIFAELAIHFAIFNLIPIGDLDGSKVFFGSRMLWFSLLILSIIFLFLSLFLI